MEEVFVKKYWDEEDVMFYVHFKSGEAIRQVEVTPKRKLLLTLDNSQKGNSMLYDQSLDKLDLHEMDFITQEEFDKIWNDL